MAMNESNKSNAIVLATQHDWATSFIFPAAVTVHALLLPHFEVRKFLPYDPVFDTLQSLLETCLPLVTVPGNCVLGYFSAHGSNHALHGRDRSHIVDGQTHRFFERGVVILTACLKDGALAAGMVADAHHVRAVIGYTNKLLVPKEEAAKAWLGPQLEGFQQRFCDALVQPIRSLLDPSCSIDRAYWETLRKWSTLHTDRSFPMRIRLVACTNGMRLKVWGDKNAYLLAD